MVLALFLSVSVPTGSLAHPVGDPQDSSGQVLGPAERPRVLVDSPSRWFDPSRPPCSLDGCPRVPLEPRTPDVPKDPCAADGCPRQPIEPKEPVAPKIPCIADGCPRPPIEPKSPVVPESPCTVDGCPVLPFTASGTDKADEPKDDTDNNPKNEDEKRDKCLRTCEAKEDACYAKRENGCQVGHVLCRRTCV